MENRIKIAFNKIKQDINFLNEEILKTKITLLNIQETLKKLEHNQNSINNFIPTFQQIIKANNASPTHNPTVPLEIKGLKNQNLGISIGNKGVPTDRQTDRQTDNPAHFIIKTSQEEIRSIESNLKEATEILHSLDNLKKEIRLKFKHLTQQEMLVFSAIYQLEEQNINEITYPLLSKMLKLSESSIRDYVHKMINKGISIKKEKINNKQILLKISPELKKIASLSTIIRLRDL